MKTLEKAQWLRPNKLKELQRERFQRLIHHAYRTVPYYHRIFDERKLKPEGVKDVNDFAKLPVLTRNDVRNNLKDLISIDYPRRKMRRSNTGGSTGEPLVFYTTRENRQWSNAARFLAWRWAGFEAGDKYAQLFGSSVDIKAHAAVRKRLEGLVKRQLSFNSYRWSEADMATFARVIAKSKPQVIYGNAVPVAMMAQFFEDSGFPGIHAKSIIIDSNQLFAREVATIERVFNCDVWWNYHNRENGTFAAECAEHDGYHLFTPNFAFEYLRDGDPVAPNETGNIVVTDFHNYAMPFIRYEVGDLGSFTEETCPCGRGLPVMTQLHGRRADILMTDRGNLVIDPFYQFEKFFDVAKIKQYQVIQKDRTHTVVRIVPEATYSDRDIERIRNMVHFILGDTMHIDIKIEKTIASTKSGKRRSVIREFPIDFNA